MLVDEELHMIAGAWQEEGTQNLYMERIGDSFCYLIADLNDNDIIDGYFVKHNEDSFCRYIEENEWTLQTASPASSHTSM